MGQLLEQCVHCDFVTAILWSEKTKNQGYFSLDIQKHKGKLLADITGPCQTSMTKLFCENNFWGLKIAKWVSLVP